MARHSPGYPKGHAGPRHRPGGDGGRGGSSADREPPGGRRRCPLRQRRQTDRQIDRYIHTYIHTYIQPPDARLMLDSRFLESGRARHGSIRDRGVAKGTASVSESQNEARES